MKKRYILTAIGALSASAVTGYLLTDKTNRKKLKQNIGKFTNKWCINNKTKSHTTLEAAGIPDQVEGADEAQMENADMVSEGSQYGVNYYNEVQEKTTNKS